MTTGTVPFLRWLGGKRWLTPTLAPALSRVLTASGGTYIEPFLGSGAMALALAPERAILSDLNAGLIECFRRVRAEPERLLEAIGRWPVDKATYDGVRAAAHLEGLQGAARFLYLNRTAYGGLYRTNRHGVFNAAFGGGSRTTAPLWDERLVERASAALAGRNVTLTCRDFDGPIRAAAAGDVVYCDPPYSEGAEESFNRYGATTFSWSDQIRLADAAKAASARGATVLVSNGPQPEIAALYAQAVPIRFWKHKRVGNRANHQTTHDEIVYVLDPEGRESPWTALQKAEGTPYGPRKALAAEPLPA